ncbi:MULTISPECIES: DUF3422 family protein [unclassified Roseateles]|uniref:DUF3422 family protein n=1 Tax=unclassified Roseateles TaxID=2626991 RepID=UPI0006FA1A13|nr:MULTISPECIES: DUF3422 domain-containing protein [unclassified Roseateles]KQW42024.1 hypothetical protein ASC81_22210 [Pelomonas sp. Root405]KRA67627.1 hypothetical protein ASD88_23795 [Pelomonas sp. Root662]
MRLLPADLPERAALSLEVHARPSEPLAAPGRASYVAVLVDADERERELAHLARLCRAHGQPAPPPDAVHWSGHIGDVRLKWERHGEFSSYTLLMPGRATVPFGDPPAVHLPPGWLAAVPGMTAYAGHAELLQAEEAPEALSELQQGFFGGRPVVGSAVGDGAGLAYSDFLIQPDGFGRLLLVDQGFTPLMAGRMLQRLFEIEAYRTMALLAFPVARRLSPRLLAIERALAGLTDDIARDGGRDETLLHELTRLAAEIESGLSASQFRFGACRAYAELVRTRIAELRERRLHGLQTVDEFMSRRFAPAVATCATVSQRMRDLSERVAQASHLLSTRVDIAREHQNHALLASMDRRAKVQLRLQQTVEGLSVAAIVYYMAGVVGYLAKGGQSLGAPLDVDLFVGLSVPVLALLAFRAVRRARRRASDQEAV